MDWSIWGPIVSTLAAAAVGALLGIAGTVMFKCGDKLHSLRVEQFEAVKTLAVAMNREVFLPTSGTSPLDVGFVISHDDMEKGLLKVKPPCR